MLRYLKEHYRTYCLMPTYQSIQDELKFTGKSTVKRRLDELIDEGYLEKVPSAANRLAPTKKFMRGLSRRS